MAKSNSEIRGNSLSERRSCSNFEASDCYLVNLVLSLPQTSSMLLGVHWHDCRVARPAWAAGPSGGVSATWPAVAGVVGFPRVRGPLQVGPNTEKLELLTTNCYYYYYYYYYYYTTTGVFLFFSSFSRLPLVTMGVRKGPHQYVLIRTTHVPTCVAQAQLFARKAVQYYLVPAW